MALVAQALGSRCGLGSAWGGEIRSCGILKVIIWAGRCMTVKAWAMKSQGTASFSTRLTL